MIRKWQASHAASHGAFNTPVHHRVHHGSNPEDLHCNDGEVLIVFDRVLGSLRRELPGVPARYGLVEPVRGDNPVRIAFHTWAGMFTDLRQARSANQVWLTVFGPPGL